MMNPQWDTPPNGDFARYVERLSAQAALPYRAQSGGTPGLDVGMTPQPSTGGGAAAGATVQRPAFLAGGGTPDGQPAAPALKKGLLTVGGVVLLMLWAAGVPLGVLVMLVGGALWAAYKLQWLKVPGTGTAKWQQVLEEASRKQKEQQQGQRK